MKTLAATIVSALALVAPASSATNFASYPGTPAVVIVTVRGGDFVTIETQAGGFYRAEDH